MKRLQLFYKSLKRLQLSYKNQKDLKNLKNLKNGKNKEDAMGCITDAMRIMSVLNHGAYWNYLRFSFIT